MIDHRQPLAQALRAQTGLAQVELVASLTQTDQHFPHIVELLRPQGRLALIDDPQAIERRALKQKSISLHWESMFTRSLFQTADMPAQGQLLATVAQLVDAGRVAAPSASTWAASPPKTCARPSVLQAAAASARRCWRGFKGGEGKRLQRGAVRHAGSSSSACRVISSTASSPALVSSQNTGRLGRQLQKKAVRCRFPAPARRFLSCRRGHRAAAGG